MLSQKTAEAATAAQGENKEYTQQQQPYVGLQKTGKREKPAAECV